MTKHRFFPAALIAAFLGVALLAQDARAQGYVAQPTFDDAIAAFNYGDNDLAFRHFSRLANEGDSRAQYYYAYMLDAGLGTGQDKSNAANWYKKSAQQDYLPAIVYLGYIYSVGQGLAKDEKEAFKWYTRGAQMGDAVAQNNLATMLQRGIPYARNLPLAAQWFLQSAMQGNTRAQYNLATMYRLGDGIKKNLCEARRWYEFAANQGDMYAQNALGYMYRVGECEAADIDKSVEWYRRAAEQGHVKSQMGLAVMYEFGDAGEGYSLDDALPWYFRAANEGENEKAMHRLGYLYERGPDKDGRGLPRDEKEALQWFKKAADKGYPPSRTALAGFYKEGKGGLKPDLSRAQEMYTDSANMGDPMAMLQLANIFKQGQPPLGRPDKVRALQWYTLAERELRTREKGTSDSQKELDNEMITKVIKGKLELLRSMTDFDKEQAQRMIQNWYPIRRPVADKSKSKLYWDEK